MKCSNCGREIRDGKAFCGFCGNKVAVEPPAFRQDYQEPTPQQPKRKISTAGRVITIVAAILSVAVIAFTALVLTGVINLIPEKRDSGRVVFKNFNADEIAYDDGRLYVEHQLLITADSRYSYEDVEKTVEKHGGSIVGSIELTNDYQALFEDADFDKLRSIADDLRGELENTEVDLHRVYYNALCEFDEEYQNGNWWREAICLDKLEEAGGSYQKVKVGIYDSAFDTQNDQLTDAFADADIPDNNTERLSDKGGAHGTDVAGFIGARKSDNAAAYGTAENTELYGFAFYGDDLSLCQSSIMRDKVAFAALMSHGVKVVNFGFSTPELTVAAQHEHENAQEDLKAFSASWNTFLKKYIDKDYDFVIVKSAGNENSTGWVECEATRSHPYGVREAEDGETDDTLYEAKFDPLGAIEEKSVQNRIIIVGSSNNNNGRSKHSARGDRVDIYAPGSMLRSISSDESVSGTSCAAAMTTGAVSLMWGRNPSVRAEDIKYLLVSSAVTTINGERYQVLSGDSDLLYHYKCLLDVKRAVQSAADYNASNRNITPDSGVVMGKVRVIDDDGKVREDVGKCTVTVYLEGQEEPYKEIETDNNGRFTIELEAGSYEIEARSEDGSFTTGRTKTEIDDGEVTHVDHFAETSASDGSYVSGDKVVEFGDTVYYVDQKGLWRFKDGDSKLLHSCKARGIATDGKTILYGVFQKEDSGYSADAGSTLKWNQYDLYTYDIASDDYEKVMSFTESGMPICKVGDTVYYTDFKEGFNGFVVGLAQSLFSYNITTGERKHLDDGAREVSCHNGRIFYRDMTAVMPAMHDLRLRSYFIDTGEISVVTDDNVYNYTVVDDVIYYLSTTGDSGKYTYTVNTCNVFGKGKKELFSVQADSVVFNDHYIVYRSGYDSSLKQYVYSIDSKKTQQVTFSGSGSFSIELIRDDIGYFTDRKASSGYAVDLKDVSKQQSFSYPSGSIVDVCQKTAFCMVGNHAYFYDIKTASITAVKDSGKKEKDSATEANDKELAGTGEKDEAGELFSKFKEPFIFSSGVGFWSTVLNINADGSFTAEYHDTDMGVRGEDYPGGTRYESEFSGTFTDLKKVNDYTYQMKVSGLTYQNEPDTDEIIDNVHVIYTKAYGLDENDTVLIYTPDAPVSELPEEFLGWILGLKSSGQTQLGRYCLYDVDGKYGFSSKNN